jgi:lipoyl(octanoyl) transferase
VTSDGKIEVIDLGIIRYKEALKVQEDVLLKRIAGETGDTLIILEHEPVVTLGRLGGADSIIDRSFFIKNGIDVVNAPRGGEVTCHMPGQLVIYPVIDLGELKRDVSFYIDFLEKAVLRALVSLGVAANRRPGERGVWVDGLKIAFTGIAVKKWVTYHGTAVNINNSMILFEKIHPCGEKDIRVTSASKCLGHRLDMQRVKKVFADEFDREFRRTYSENMQKTGV